MSRNLTRYYRHFHINDLTLEDWSHIRETARALRDDLDPEEPDEGVCDLETVMTSIGYADVGYDTAENIGWIESHGDRVEFDPDDKD